MTQTYDEWIKQHDERKEAGAEREPVIPNPLYDPDWQPDQGPPVAKKCSFQAIGTEKIKARHRVRVFRFDESSPLVIPNKYGPGRHEYALYLTEWDADTGKKVGGSLKTAAKGLLTQIRGEIKEHYTSGAFTRRVYVLVREGDGKATSYWLRGFEKEADALDEYKKAVVYMRERAGAEP